MCEQIESRQDDITRTGRCTVIKRTYIRTCTLSGYGSVQVCVVPSSSFLLPTSTYTLPIKIKWKNAVGWGRKRWGGVGIKGKGTMRMQCSAVQCSAVQCSALSPIQLLNSRQILQTEAAIISVKCIVTTNMPSPAYYWQTDNVTYSTDGSGSDVQHVPRDLVLVHQHSGYFRNPNPYPELTDPELTDPS